MRLPTQFSGLLLLLILLSCAGFSPVYASRDDASPSLQSLLNKLETKESNLQRRITLFGIVDCYLEESKRAEALHYLNLLLPMLKEASLKEKTAAERLECRNLLLLSLIHKKDCLFLLNRVPEALACANEFIALDNQNASVFFERSEIFVRLKRYEEAIRDQTTCIRLTEITHQKKTFDHAQDESLAIKALYARSKCYAILGKKVQAAEDLKRANTLTESL